MTGGGGGGGGFWQFLCWAVGFVWFVYAWFLFGGVLGVMVWDLS